MKISFIPTSRGPYFYGFLISLFLAALLIGLFSILPTFISSNYYQNSLNHLRNQAKAIKAEYSQLITELKNKEKFFSSSSFPEKEKEIFALFKELNLDKKKEGIAYYNSRGDLMLWMGNVIDLRPLFPRWRRGDDIDQADGSLLIRDKASVYLVFTQRIRLDKILAHYRLLAFKPQLQAPYLKEYHFLSSKLLGNCFVDYRDYREDVSGVETFFSRHKDEYIGQPSLQDEVQTIFFPLRNERGKIAATVRLSSPALSARISSLKEYTLLFFYLALGLALLFLLLSIVKTPLFHKERKAMSLISVILILAGLRALFFPLSQLEKIQSLSYFSPTVSSFLSFWNFTKSPADIFLTSFFLFLIVLSIGFHSRNLQKERSTASSVPLMIGTHLIFVAGIIFLTAIFQEILFRLVFHSNINLLRFSFSPPFLLVHLSLIFFFLSLALILFIGRHLLSPTTRRVLPFLVIFLLVFAVYFLLIHEKTPSLLLVLQAFVILSIFFLAELPKKVDQKLALLTSFLIGTLFIYVSLHVFTSYRNRLLIEHTLPNIIESQEHWGHFLMRESFPEIEKRTDSIISFLENSEPRDLARSIWERTLIAKFNWYSSLEILSAEGAILSRFSLNVPSLFRLDYDLPLSSDWTILRQSVPFMGKEKDFLIAYKDWLKEERYQGRMILYLLVDYDMLPFLYSANPYFELLRVSSLPSLNQFDLGFAIYDLNAKLIFDPDKISSGISPPLLEDIQASSGSLWASFKAKNKKFECFYFRSNSKIYALFLPVKNVFDYIVEYLKLFFLYFIFSFLMFIFLAVNPKKREFRHPLWSFSNRVYISFFVVAIIPLLLFTIFTRNFFSRIFTQQFTEKAEIHANLAQRVMKDYFFLQQEEQLSPTLPPENVVLWISSTISNDVNLYQDGNLISSSRREFFDAGLLPELVDGEIYYKIRYENTPLITQIQKIGDYTFHTLTIPYFLGQQQLLLSLPFPLEQQEISDATAQLIEFLFLISVFFAAVVMFFARSIGGTIITPIKKLLVGTKEVSLGNLEISIQHKPQDEMKTLIDGFNAMVTSLKQHQQELAEMSKKVVWAEMARKVAHEIKNPLTPIQLSAEHILKVFEDKPQDLDRILKESASYIIKEVENLRKISHDFLEISKETPLRKQTIDLRETIRETVELYKKILAERIRFKEIYEGQDFHLIADKAKLKIALRNILINATEAIREKGKIQVKVARTANSMKIEISDTGIGMKKIVLDNIFEPYFSTKEAGTGLGLAITKKIIESHRGTIQAESQEGKGTIISIKLPLNTEA